MKIQAITFDEQDMPETITAVLTLPEAAALARLTGQLTQADIDKKGLSGLPSVTTSVYSALVGTVINPYFENGTPEAIAYAEEHTS